MARKKKKKNVFNKYLSIVLLILTIIFFIIIIRFNIIPNNYLLIGGIIISIIVLLIVFKLNKSNKKILYVFSSAILILLEILIIIYSIGTIDFLNKIIDTGYRAESYGIYILVNQDYKLKDLSNKKIGYYQKDNNINNAINKLKNKIKFDDKEYSSISILIDEIQNNKIDAIYINENNMEIYLEEHDIKIKKIDSIEILVKNDSNFKMVDVTEKPFVLYISGIDTTGKVNKSARSDVNILAFINPLKEKILLVNTPRDYYVTLPSKNANDKLTHAGIYGINESAKALELLYGVDINYYVRINFTSFINIINDLNGIVVNVEKPDYRYNDGFDCGINYICEQNSKREWDNKTIYIKAGNNIKLNGEESLAYARNRHQFADGDRARGYHQEQIIKAIIEKAASFKTITKYNDVLKDLVKGMITNIDQNTISKFINYEINNMPNWEIDMISAEGINGYEKCYSLDNLKAFVLKPNLEVIDNIKNKIKEIIN